VRAFLFETSHKLDGSDLTIFTPAMLLTEIGPFGELVVFLKEEKLMVVYREDYEHEIPAAPREIHLRNRDRLMNVICNYREALDEVEVRLGIATSELPEAAFKKVISFLNHGVAVLPL